jgi:hypothetical protein
MVSRPIITRQSARRQERWTFVYNAEGHVLEPDSYRRERRRQDARYRFRTVALWTRLYRAQDEPLRVEHVPLPADVAAEAKAEFVSSLRGGRATKRFCTWLWVVGC